MAIQVTPIPRLVTLVAPDFTLSTSNVAGSEKTAVASDATILAYDATVPTTIATPSTSAPSASAGSAATAGRRDHVHGSPAIYDTTVPTTIASGASAATGSASVSARRDHTHGMFTTAAGFTSVASGSTSVSDNSVVQVNTAVMTDAAHYIIVDSRLSSGSKLIMNSTYPQGNETTAATKMVNYGRAGNGSSSDYILLTEGEAETLTHDWSVKEIS